MIDSLEDPVSSDSMWKYVHPFEIWNATLEHSRRLVRIKIKHGR